jgi:hypothetical protein
LQPREQNISFRLTRRAEDHIIVQAGFSFFRTRPSCRYEGATTAWKTVGLGDAIDDIISWIDGWVGARGRAGQRFYNPKKFARDRGAFLGRLQSLNNSGRRYLSIGDTPGG